jgi:mono/diheme cytochrome c family protein
MSSPRGASPREPSPVRTAALAAVAVATFAGLGVLKASTAPAPARPSLGRAASAQEIARMDISVDADGQGLPPGSGSVAEGARLFAEKCEACHGAAGAGGMADPLVGGVGGLSSSKPLRTVTSYWPYAPPLFDYIRRAMPLTEPQSLSNDETYALVAYLLAQDKVVAPDAVLNAASLSAVRMPNRDGFRSLESRGFDGNLDRIPPAP